MNQNTQHDNCSTCGHLDGPCPTCNACIADSMGSPNHTPQELAAMGYCPICGGADDCPSWAIHQS